MLIHPLTTIPRLSKPRLCTEHELNPEGRQGPYIEVYPCDDLSIGLSNSGLTAVDKANRSGVF